MGVKTVTGLVCAVVLLLVGAVGAYAWDSSKSSQIAEGVQVGEVDLGGLDEQAAAERLRAELIKPLEEPVKVVYKDEKFKLPPAKLDIHADIDGMVAEALAASREGGLPTRLVRYATGEEIERTIEPRVAYSETAVDRFVEGLAASIDRPAQDASVSPSPSALTVVEAKKGVALRDGRLRKEIVGAVEGSGERTITAEVETVKPEVTKKTLASNYPFYITVDRANFKLRLFRNLKLEKEYTVAVGQAGYDTPTGTYHIQNKAVDPVWNVPEREWAGELAGTTVPGGAPENPLKERWMGIYDGAGIHGTDAVGSLGSAASHGCIRMAIPDVIELYDKVPVGAPVYIQ